MTPRPQLWDWSRTKPNAARRIRCAGFLARHPAQCNAGWQVFFWVWEKKKQHCGASEADWLGRDFCITRGLKWRRTTTASMWTGSLGSMATKQGINNKSRNRSHSHLIPRPCLNVSIVPPAHILPPRITLAHLSPNRPLNLSHYHLAQLR